MVMTIALFSSAKADQRLATTQVMASHLFFQFKQQATGGNLIICYRLTNASPPYRFDFHVSDGSKTHR
jgi:hypothetical protein